VSKQSLSGVCIVTRALDLLAVIAVAVVLLLPKASLEASPALDPADVHKVDRDRVGALEDAVAIAPADEARVVALADAYLRLEHPDWALAVTAHLGPGAGPSLRLLRATARAERLEARLALLEVDLGLEACARPSSGCDETTRVRFGVLQAGMKALVDGGIDPASQPVKAREAVAGVLHTTKAGDLLAPKRPGGTTGPGTTGPGTR
jgi:hypothetical protein